MTMVRAMELQTGDYPSKQEAATLEEQYDDSMDPRAIILGDLNDYVSFPPIIDISRIKGSDFNKCDNDNKEEQQIARLQLLVVHMQRQY